MRWLWSWLSRRLCRHHWRYNFYDLHTGLLLGLLMRRCQKCGQWQDRDLKTMKWRMRTKTTAGISGGSPGAMR